MQADVILNKPPPPLVLTFRVECQINDCVEFTGGLGRSSAEPSTKPVLSSQLAQFSVVFSQLYKINNICQVVN